ncbi:hypothetical protein [Salinimicrobium soli]|uniref:hypothetical protein n=1 Tax=Salinimicrobium soli TaxID=1254399 RepID=UPI003AAC0363
MPMPYDGYNWRPNDNSATTNLRYTLEAEKWVNAVSSAQRRAQPRSISGDLAFIGMVVQLILCVVLLIVLGLLQLLKALIKFVESSVNNSNKKAPQVRKKKHEKTFTDEEFSAGGKKPDKVWTIKEEKQYPRGWQLIFWTRWGRLRYFWQFLFLLITIFLIEMVVLFLLSQWIPNYVTINKEVIIFAAGVSLWNAFLGVDA